MSGRGGWGWPDSPGISATGVVAGSYPSAGQLANYTVNTFGQLTASGSTAFGSGFLAVGAALASRTFGAGFGMSVTNGNGSAGNPSYAATFGYHGYQASSGAEAMPVAGTDYAIEMATLEDSAGNGFNVATQGQLKVTGTIAAIPMRIEATFNDALMNFASDFYNVRITKNGTGIGPTVLLRGENFRISCSMSVSTTGALNDVFGLTISNQSGSANDNFEGLLMLNALILP